MRNKYKSNFHDIIKAAMLATKSEKTKNKNK
jgi:hypothetical protein